MTTAKLEIEVDYMDTILVPVLSLPSEPAKPLLPRDDQDRAYLDGILSDYSLQAELERLRGLCRKFHGIEDEWPAAIGLHWHVTMALLSEKISHLDIPQENSDVVSVPFEVEPGSAPSAFVIRGKTKE